MVFALFLSFLAAWREVFNSSSSSPWASGVEYLLSLMNERKRTPEAQRGRRRYL
jgi:hypothetical protein